MKITVLALAVAFVTAGCGGALDGGNKADGGSFTDAPACDCRVADGVLTMSWGCFCDAGYCSFEAPVCSSYTTGALRTAYAACGLTTATQETVGGPQIWVYDQAGALVGKQLGTDAGWFMCPSDPNLKASVLRAGRFPEPTCAGTACGCANGAATCPSFDRCGCALTFDPFAVMTMSWDCFCEKFGCSWQLGAPNPANCQSQRRVDYPDCGLTRLTPNGPFSQFEAVFDGSGQLVGETQISDTSPYTCPSDPTTKANQVRAGRYPEPSCRAVECEPCYAGAFPCPERAVDGGAGG